MTVAAEARWTLDRAATAVVPCPLCGGTAFTRLCATDRYDMNVVTVGCNGCGLVMTNPQPVAAALDDFYAAHYRRYYQKVAVPTLEYIRQFRKDERAAYTASFLRDVGALAGGGAVLDIGASEGCILKALRDLAPGLRCTAVEPNPDFGAFAKAHAGCELAADLESLRQGGRRFDLVILNHVFEHLPDPVAYLRGLATLLTPSGRVYIDVPNLLEYEGLESLHIAHLYHFSPRTLAATAAGAGYEVIVMERHTPVMHPKSIRTLLRPVASAPRAELAASQEGWDLIRTIARGATRYHRRRWPWYWRLLAGLRDRLPSAQRPS